ncbi:8-oxo-dGTP pyrophosphatase MutT (NUDIX family) [Nocardia kruczakiae]|uniref:8-oxo-dGTP pyrophosphatase MutT (NUDIX family) n=1 Tax=Nocardia kruczakiae TaxID=261477 RepID=A0ABU1XFQ5_9NOCA|nr:hypothetical protein [Nocardia kruczakiae]MDR7169383.1 8-oxo-dGTP pyrophosphatase MutT (NUDIX family) [Nocardia kruczakiae]
MASNPCRRFLPAAVLAVGILAGDPVGGMAVSCAQVPSAGDIVVPGGSFEPDLGSSHYRPGTGLVDLLWRLL